MIVTFFIVLFVLDCYCFVVCFPFLVPVLSGLFPDR